MSEELEKEKLENDMAETLYRYVFSFAVGMVLLLILSISLFWGSPDLIDALIIFLSNTNPKGVCG